MYTYIHFQFMLFIFRLGSPAKELLSVDSDASLLRGLLGAGSFFGVLGLLSLRGLGFRLCRV